MHIECANRRLIAKGSLTYQNLSDFIKAVERCNPDVIDLSRIDKIDTSCIVFVSSLDVELVLNDKGRRLLDIVSSHKPRQHFEHKKYGFFYRLGEGFLQRLSEFYAFLSFLGEIFVGFLGFFHPKRFRLKAALNDIEIMGFNAMPILATISFLIGAVIAYHGSVRLKQFGANIFVVDLVSISVLRELGPLIVAILLAGRSSSSYTAQIGIMKVTEEVDVIKTMGVNPYDILVFPKIISMLISVPLLIVLADVMGVLGGMLVAHLSLGITPRDFILRLHHAIGIKTFLSGILKAPAFAFLIATIGAFKGFQTKRNVESIGKSITISVVDCIFGVIIADAVFSVLFRWMGI
ncbi:MlaE family ABC transporter permease [Hippea sp. KM1]|uniref:MlaE family ABC transporter permease n=1 Tax=Hippea sp. KM1 TaxID=944481 RepID=UPI00046CE50F|nr:ABC transporter permease [Hippea sp. KM1]